MAQLIHVVGNRPQFIKLAVLFKELAPEKQLTQTIVHSGQHFSYDMSELFFEDLHIPAPHVNFNIQNLSRDNFIIEAAHKFEKYFESQKNAAVLVYGDTNTTLAAAMAAKKTGLPLLHFEAGVRTRDNEMPEEINRIITDKLADVNYCCTEKNYAAMQQEGYGISGHGEIILTGDLMLDAFLKIPTATTGIRGDRYVVSTIHRDANLGKADNLKNIIAALNEIHKNIPVVMPLHPHTKKRLGEYGITPAFETVPPMGYPEMKQLLTHAEAVITDSGGMSREAYFLNKRSLIIMESVFWPEITQMKCSLQSNAEKEMIIRQFNALPGLEPDFATAIFGTGTAAENIHRHLNDFLQLS